MGPSAGPAPDWGTGRSTNRSAPHSAASQAQPASRRPAAPAPAVRGVRATRAGGARGRPCGSVGRLLRGRTLPCSCPTAGRPTRATLPPGPAAARVPGAARLSRSPTTQEKSLGSAAAGRPAPARRLSRDAAGAAAGRARSPLLKSRQDDAGRQQVRRSTGRRCAGGGAGGTAPPAPAACERNGCGCQVTVRPSILRWTRSRRREAQLIRTWNACVASFCCSGVRLTGRLSGSRTCRRPRTRLVPTDLDGPGCRARSSLRRSRPGRRPARPAGGTGSPGTARRPYFVAVAVPRVTSSSRTVCRPVPGRVESFLYAMT